VGVGSQSPPHALHETPSLALRSRSPSDRVSWHGASCPYSPECVEKLSEESRRSLGCSLTEHRNGTFGPILISSRLPNPRSECCSYPFSDSFRTRL
jgi:hypothetical protein